MPITRARKERQKNRTRKKVKRSSQRPRLSVFRSNKHIYGQIIDDQQGHTLAAANDFHLTDEEKKKTKKEQAFTAGELLAERAVEKGIKKVVFDKGAYAYHGRVKAFAEGARQGGLDF